VKSIVRHTELLNPAALVVACVMLASACATGDPPAPSAPDTAPIAAAESAPAAAPPATPAEPAEPAAPVARAGVPLPIDDTVQRAGERLFGDAYSVLGDAPRELVVDPLIDARTGAQTVGSVAVGERLAALVASRYPMWAVKPLSRETLARSPLLLIGTLTPVDLNGAADDPPDAYRLWLTLADLRSGHIVAKRLDRATTDSVDAQPTRFFHDSPVWRRDRRVAAYVDSTQIDARVGASLDPLYLKQLPATALLNEAIAAYNDDRLAPAQRLFVDAARLADADDLRVLNGRYLTSWRLGQRQDAERTAARIVAHGLFSGQLSLLLPFEPASATLRPGADVRASYRLWVREVARQVNERRACLRVVGHTSRRGSAQAAEALALRQAAVVRWSLARAAPASARRFSAEGAGWRDNLTGLGTDDARDAFDRRVELRVVDCP
jgi:outer membrane protein OmpA-like peptidoglycan-associated protein